ncbi:MAG: radical SAM protein [Woeseia sp.]
MRHGLPNERDSRRQRNKKILIANCYFPEMREPIKRINEVPNALAPVLLAGHFCPRSCDIELYNEVNSGFLEIFKPELLGWPDVLVLTGLTAAFDRMLHIAAYVRTKNPNVIVVAGGHGVRSLPRYSEHFFDYACQGDVEEIKEVIRDCLGEQYVAREFKPRYDLAYWMKRFGYVESSRNCNFRCSFCSLTGASRPYAVNAPDYLDVQMEAAGKRQILFFEDNQLLGDGQKTFARRIAQVQQRREAGQFKHWGGFVTDTFFWKEENIQLAHDTGCISLFVGVESFDDTAWLGSVNKAQNAKKSQVELIRRCLDGGVLFQYGLVFDPTERTVAQMYREMDIICDNPEIPLPLFMFTAIPFPGTPLFHERIAKNQILPNTKMRDLESSTLTLKPLDPVDDVINFIKTGKNFRGYHRRVFRHQREFLKRYSKSLSFDQKLVSTLGMLAILYPGRFSSPGSMFVRQRPRTHLSTTDHLDCVYTPRHDVHRRWRDYFKPTVLVNAAGELNPLLQDDALDTRFRSKPTVAAAVAS